MTQSTILAVGNTSATSTDIVVAAGVSVTVGIFSVATDTLDSSTFFSLMIDTPSADNLYAKLSAGQSQVRVVGPGTFRVVRPAYVGTAFGVWLEA